MTTRKYCIYSLLYIDLLALDSLLATSRLKQNTTQRSQLQLTLEILIFIEVTLSPTSLPVVMQQL